MTCQSTRTEFRDASARSQNRRKNAKERGTITSAAPPNASRRYASAKRPRGLRYLIRGVGSLGALVIVGGIVPFLMFFMLVRKTHLYDWLDNAFGEKMGRPGGSPRASPKWCCACPRQSDHRAAWRRSPYRLLRAETQGAVPLGIASGFLNLVPFVGAILAAALPLLAPLLEVQTRQAVPDYPAHRIRSSRGFLERSGPQIHSAPA